MMNLRNKKVSVLGLGRSGISAISLLKEQGASVFGSDMRKTLEVYPDIEFELGENTERILDADLIVTSPGIPYEHSGLTAARKRGIPIIGELELASWFIECPIIGVTGTNGKTTTCFLIQNIMKEASIDSAIAGNMGKPLCSLIKKIKKDTVVIVEVSSFQLETIDLFRPYVSVLLNITPDHLNRHRTMDDYIKAKAKIFKNQRKNDYAILNFDDEIVRGLSNGIHAKKLYFSLKESKKVTAFLEDGYVWYSGKKVMKLKSSLIPLEDIIVSVLVSKLFKIEDHLIERGISSFKGVPHRMENLGEVNGRVIINNSMCTNPHAFAKSLSILGKKAVVIMGGKSKKVNIKILLESASNNAKFCVVMGETQKEIIHGLHKIGYKNAIRAEDMRDAVRKAYSHSSLGDTIILSPGFASFDMFNDFAERGDKFKKEIKMIR